MATFVIVHGAFGGGWQWREVATLLRARGHDVFTPSLTGFARTRASGHAGDGPGDPHPGRPQRAPVRRSAAGRAGLPELRRHGHDRGRRPDAGAPGPPHLPQRTGARGRAVGIRSPAARHAAALRGAARTAGEGWRIPAPPLEDDPRIAAFARGRHVPSLLRMFDRADPARSAARPCRAPSSGAPRTRPAGGGGGPDAAVRRAGAARAGLAVPPAHLAPDAFIFVPRAVADLFDEAAQSS